MKLTIDDRFLIMIFDSVEEERIIRDNFTFDDLSAVYIGGKFDKRKIKRKCLIDTKKGIHLLNGGFLLDLLLLLKKENISLTELQDKRSKFPFYNIAKPTDILRQYFPSNFKYIDHQVEALRKMLKVNCGIIQAPPSAGKTELMIAYIKATKLPTLIVVNRISLALQIRERLQKNGIEAGICYGKEYVIAPCMITTIGSVGRVNTQSFQVLILDECHRAQASQYQKFLKTHSFPIRFGLSATPDCGDKYKFALIRQYIGNIIYKVDIKELMKNEVIAKPKISFVKSLCHSTMDWFTAYNSCIVFNNERNNKIKELVEKYNLPTLILIRMIEHGEELSKLLPDAVFVSGIDDALYRKEIIEKFEKGEIKTIISSNIFNEGISINAIRLLIIASGGKSKIETIQKLGRSMRVTPDKKECIVIDFLDEGNVFTERHSIMRSGIYERAGFEVMHK